MGAQEQEPLNPALELMERTEVRAQRHAKDCVDKPLPPRPAVGVRVGLAEVRSSDLLHSRPQLLVNMLDGVGPRRRY